MVGNALEPGWYWYHYLRSDELAEVDAFRGKNQGRMLVRKVFSGSYADSQVIVFEVVGGLDWTLPNQPVKTKRGVEVTLHEIAKSEQARNSWGLRKLIEELSGKAFDVFRNTGRALSDTAESANTALKVLAWGAAAVLLFNLYMGTRPEVDGD